MSKSILEGFDRSNVQIEPPLPNPTILPDITQTLARLLGFDPLSKRFLIINADSDGRLLVSQSTTKTTTGVVTRVVLTGSTQLALPENTSRRSFRLLNRSAVLVKVGFSTPITTSYFTLDPNGTYSDDIYSGNIYLLGSAADIVEVLEY
jgi:hypothetical protein